MKINSLYLKNYRNIEEIKINFSEGLNIFVGDNGQGKTNILEAIYLLTHGDSFRYGQNEAFIRFNQDQAYIVSQIENQNLDYVLKLVLDKNRKKFLVNDKPLTSKNDPFPPAVLFSPESLSVIKDSAEQRRDLIDELVIMSSSLNHTLVKDFRKALRTRNKLLKDISENKISYEANKSYLESLNSIFLNLATELTSLRIKLLLSIESDITKILREIEGKTEVTFGFEYVISDQKIDSENKENIYQIMRKRLAELTISELSYGGSLVGPQKHDLVFLYTGKDSRFFCSQGQQRSIILAYKMAQIVYHYRVNGFYPVLLLDDVLSELDQRKQEALINYLNEVKTQTFLTTTNVEVLDKLNNDSTIKFLIKNGNVSK